NPPELPVQPSTCSSRHPTRPSCHVIRYSGRRDGGFKRTRPTGSYPRRVHPDTVDAAARRDVERLLVGVAEAHIGGYFRRPDGADVLAFRRDDPHAPRTGLVEIALGIDPQSIRDARLGLPAHVDEQLAVGERAVREHLIAIDVIVAA